MCRCQGMAQAQLRLGPQGAQEAGRHDGSGHGGTADATVSAPEGMTDGRNRGRTKMLRRNGAGAVPQGARIGTRLPLAAGGRLSHRQPPGPPSRAFQQALGAAVEDRRCHLAVVVRLICRRLETSVWVVSPRSTLHGVRGAFIPICAGAAARTSAVRVFEPLSVADALRSCPENQLLTSPMPALLR